MTKRPRDPNQLAKLTVDIVVGEAEDSISESKRHPSRKRKGGLKGGKSRALKPTSVERTDIARLAAEARWKKEVSIRNRVVRNVATSQ